MTPPSEKENAKDADAISTVITPHVISVETENPTRNPQDGICNWCRNKPGDIYCDGFPCCWECLDIDLERERALFMADQNGFGDKWRSEYYDSLVPSEWEKY